MVSAFLNLTCRQYLLVLTILVIVFLAFWPSVQNGFVNWDDDVHLTENPALRGLDGDHLQQIFSQTINHIYVPLTTLSFAIEYFFRQYDPFLYHLDNLLLHLLNTWLVFIICGQLGLTVRASGLAALLFGLHPTHVESVAWVTERKDVLYGAFYLLAMHLYLRYIKEANKNLYLFSWFSGLFSMLAKPMALSLPLILLVLDWLKGRKFERNLYLEKVPYVLIIVSITLITYLQHARIPAQKAGEAVLIGTWTFIFYIRKFVFPFDLCPLYKLPLLFQAKT